MRGFSRRMMALLAATAVSVVWTIFSTESASAAVPGLHLVGASSAADSFPVKSATAYCPPGERVLGGGGFVLRTSGELQAPGLALAWLKPVHPTDGSRDYYIVYGEENGVGTSDPWQVVAHAVCAPNTGHQLNPVIVEGRSTFSSASVHTAAAVCPSGKRVVGTGATSYAVNGQVALQVSRASASGDIARAQAHEDVDGWGGSWFVSSWAVCANPPAGYQVVSGQSTEHNSETFKAADRSCPAGKRALSVGAALTSTAPAEVALWNVAFDTADLSQFGAAAQENWPFFTSWDYLLVRGICVTA